MNEQNQYGLVDLTYLREISSNDIEFIREMLDMFLMQTPELMEDLKKSIEEANYVDIKANAHKVKPTFAMVGRDDFKEIMQRIEDYAKENAPTIQIEQMYEVVASNLQLLFDDINVAKIELQKCL